MCWDVCRALRERERACKRRARVRRIKVDCALVCKELLLVEERSFVFAGGDVVRREGPGAESGCGKWYG